MCTVGALITSGCDPYRSWPDEASVFPYVYTPETDLEHWEEVRFETETWTVQDNPDQAGLYLAKAAYHRTGAPVEELAHFAALNAELPPVSDRAALRLSFAGDVMWVGENWSAFLTPSAELLDGDVRVGNLETPVSAADPTDLSELELLQFNSPDAILDALPFDVLQLNNNHSLDMGNDGLESTVAAVSAHGYASTGVDAHASVDVNDGRVVFLSYTWGVNDPSTPTDHDLFIVPFGHLDEPVDMSRIQDDVAVAREAAEFVVVLLHWGFEYEYYPDPHFMQLAREIIRFGADVIVGEGPHVVQPVEICAVNQPDQVPGVGVCSVRTEDDVPRTAAVVYSLGNFGTFMATVPCQVGIVATVDLQPGAGVSGLGWAAAAAKDAPEGGLSVLPLDTLLDDQELAAEAERLDAHIGTVWKR